MKKTIAAILTSSQLVNANPIEIPLVVLDQNPQLKDTILEQELSGFLSFRIEGDYIIVSGTRQLEHVYGSENSFGDLESGLLEEFLRDELGTEFNFLRSSVFEAVVGSQDDHPTR